MRNTFKVLFYANKGKEKNGFVPIPGRLTVNGQVARFSCKLPALTVAELYRNRWQIQMAQTAP